MVFDGSDKAKRILGITSGSGGPDMNKVYAKYFEDNGIGVVAMEGMGVEFKSIPEVPRATIASFIKKAFAEHAGADAVYILGSSLEALRRSNASWACRSCKRLPRASGKSRSASMCTNRSRAMAACSKHSRPRRAEQARAKPPSRLMVVRCARPRRFAARRPICVPRDRHGSVFRRRPWADCPQDHPFESSTVADFQRHR